MLWDCPAYASIRSAFMLELSRELGDIGLSTFIVLRSRLMSLVVRHGKNILVSG